MKKIRLIKTNTPFIGYPVGASMKTNMAIMRTLAEFYVSIAPKGVHNIFCQGSSGIIMATIFAQVINQELLSDAMVLPIRRAGEFTHSPHAIYDVEPDNINIIVDDFICSGDTVKRVHEAMTSKMIGCTKLYAVIVGRANGTEDVINMQPDLFIAGSFSVPIPKTVSFETINITTAQYQL